MSAPSQKQPSDRPQGVPADDLVDLLEQQLGKAAGQIARLQLALQAHEGEIRYLRSLLPDTTTPEG